MVTDSPEEFPLIDSITINLGNFVATSVSESESSRFLWVFLMMFAIWFFLPFDFFALILCSTTGSDYYWEFTKRCKPISHCLIYQYTLIERGLEPLLILSFITPKIWRLNLKQWSNNHRLLHFSNNKVLGVWSLCDHFWDNVRLNYKSARAWLAA